MKLRKLIDMKQCVGLLVLAFYIFATIYCIGWNLYNKLYLAAIAAVYLAAFAFPKVKQIFVDSLKNRRGE